tara:strand:- start:305 stop:463 length:159 start_codon:yes stop_codon:yes gene_type:complete
MNLLEIDKYLEELESNLEDIYKYMTDNEGINLKSLIHTDIKELKKYFKKKEI